MNLSNFKDCIYGDYIDQLYDGQFYFRYDTDHSTPKENWSVYCDIQEDLAVDGYMLVESYIEHDCITGYIVSLKSD